MVGVFDLGESGAHDAVVAAGEEQGGAQPVVGELVAVGVGDPVDEAVEAESSQVVGELAGGQCVGGNAE